jgi:hypothetical protein
LWVSAFPYPRNIGDNMPLKYGKKNIGKNISMLMKEGRGRKQSVAIALSQSRKRKRK